MNLSIRNATVADYEVFARLHAALEFPDPVPSAEQSAQRVLLNVILICDAGDPIGYAHWGVYGATAHAIHVVFDAAARRCGVGRLLMQDLRTRVITSGCRRWYLNVETNNFAAIRLYERTGLAMEQRGWALLGDWLSLQRLPGTTSHVTADATEEEIARLAQQHTINPERLTMVRARPGQIFVALRDHTDLYAFAAFDPTFPGIYPIAATQPEHARALHDALRPHAHTRHVNIFVEGNSALAEALHAAGAKLQFEICRMGASQP